MTVHDTEADPLLAVLIEHSGELKRQLVQFAQGPRFEPELRGKLLEVAGDDMTMDEATWIRIVDDFIFGYRFPDGTTVLDKFIQENQDLPAAEREMLQGWSTQVDGIFELRRKHEDSLSVLNLIDDLEYRVYTNASPQAFGSLREGEFLVSRLVPVRDCWIVSGMLSSYPQSGAQAIAKVALKTATKHANLAFRNPLIVERGWEAMRRHRELFIEFFGSDEVVLPPAEAERQLNEQRRQPGVSVGDLPWFSLPSTLFEFETVGMIFDDVDGLNFLPAYGTLRELFADPSLASDEEYAEPLRAYLREDSILPLPLYRLAAAYPDTVDEVYQEVLHRSGFSWTDHGEALLREYKPGYYEREPRPGVTVIGGRLKELLG
jgi:hypothetical protein